MKTIIDIDKAVGGDGFTVKGALGVEASNIKLEFSALYPIEKVLEPALKVLDEAIDKLEELIPGSWDKPFADNLKVESRAKLIALLSE